MEENYEGKRVEAKNGLSRRAKILIASICGGVVLLLGAYLALCGWAGAGGRMLPGVELAGVDLGRKTPQEARELLTAAQDRYQDLELPITIAGKTTLLSGREAEVRLNVDAAVAAGEEYSRGSFITAGGRYLKGLFGAAELDSPIEIGNPDYVERTLAQAVRAAALNTEENRWSVDEDTQELVVYRGRTGRRVDMDDLRRRITSALERGDVAPIEAVVAEAAPVALDFEQIAQKIDREMANATLNEEYEVIDHIVGLKLDPAAAKAAFDATAEGAVCRVALTVTEPEIDADDLRASLFKDILGEASSQVSGTADRNTNVRIAAEHCNGKILRPGERFSYNETIKCSAEEGYQMGSAYVAGRSVDVVGGGVCQVSSTIYYASLLADLEIVERHNHRYAVGYVPDGMDATVYAPSLDFIIANNTPYPIRIESVYANRTMTVKIYGTKTTENYVKMENKRLSTTPYEDEYVPDESVPQGTTQIKQTPYTGRKVEAYKCVYDKDGNLLSRTLESVNEYKSRNRVTHYNPADPAPGSETAAPVEPVSPTTETPTTPPPAVTPPPVETPPVVVTPPPVAVETPPAVVTPPPVAVETPSVLDPQPSPVETPAPEASVDISLLPSTPPDTPPAGIPLD